MSRAAKDLSVRIRPYVDPDESSVVELLTASLGGGPAGERPVEFFRWKHVENPFGRSFMLVAEDRGRIVGLRAFMRWRFVVDGQTRSAVRAVDTATHPEYQGRGIFSRLTLAALDALREDVDVVFNTPNEKSLPGYLKMGWQVVGRVPVSVRVRRPLRFARGLRSIDGSVGAPVVGPASSRRTRSAAEVLTDADVRELVDSAEVAPRRMWTPRTRDYLIWRYGSPSRLDYRAVRVDSSGRPRALAVFRIRSRGSLLEATVAEVIVRPGDRAAATEALRRVARAVPVDHLTCLFPPGSAASAAAARTGFLRTPRGPTFVVNPLRDGILPSPTTLGSWGLTLGDLEVF